MTIEELTAISNAEADVQFAYTNGKTKDGRDFLTALRDLQQVNAQSGLLSNKVTMVNSAVTTIGHLTENIFATAAERQAALASAQAQIDAEEEEELKERLLQEYRDKEAAG